MKELLTEAKNEILVLRRVNELLSAKVEVMDLFACVLHTTAAHRGSGGGDDVAWKLQLMINDIEAKAALSKNLGV